MLSFLPDYVMFPICVGGIYGCYFIYGYLQEEIIAVEKINAVLPLLSQYVIALVVSFGINFVIDIVNNKSFELFNFSEMYLGLLNNLTMLASNYSLAYIDYPTQALVKSSKILPVLAFGFFRKTYNHALYKYVCAVFITIGLVVFNLAKIGSKVSGMAFNAIGMFLLFISLFFDGLLATETDIVKKKRKNSNPFYMMIANNIVGLLSSLTIVVFTYVSANEYILEEITKDNIKPLILIGLSGTIGQIFIYITIDRFDCFYLSIVNTSRKFFSILFSIIWFNHTLTTVHWIGITIVLGAITVDVIFSEMERGSSKKKHD